MLRILFSLLLFVLSTGAAGAETTKLTLRDAVSRAMTNNHLIKAAGFGVSAAQQGIAIADARNYPTVFFEENLTASNMPTQTFMMKLDQGRFSQEDFQIDNLNHPSMQHDFKTAVTVQQSLYDPATVPSRTIAVKEAEKASSGFQGVRQDIAFLVFRLYLEVQKSKAQLAAAEQAVVDAQENLRLATVRSEAGSGLRSDELRARTHLASVEQQRITALNNLTLAKLQLARSVGATDGETVDIAEPSTSFLVTMTPEDLGRSALISRSDLKLSQTALEKAEAEIHLARSAYLPKLSAMASYQRNAQDISFSGDNDGWMAGASLNWQIFDGFRRARERARATAGRDAAAEMVADKATEITLQVKESMLRREEMGKRLEVSRHALLDAEETVRLLTKRFENSLSTMLEMLDAQTALNQTRANLVETETNFTLASGRVYYAAGLFLQEILK